MPRFVRFATEGLAKGKKAGDKVQPKGICIMLSNTKMKIGKATGKDIVIAKSPKLSELYSKLKEKVKDNDGPYSINCKDFDEADQIAEGAIQIKKLYKLENTYSSDNEISEIIDL